MRWSGLPGNRVEPQRAGMIPSALLIGLFQNNLGCVCEIARNPIGAAGLFLRPISGLDKNRSDSGRSSTLDIARFVADEPGAREVEAAIALCFENHSGRGLASRGIRPGHVGTIIGSIDKSGPELPQKLLLDQTIILLGKITAPDSALVCNDDQFVAPPPQPPQRHGRCRKNLN